MLEQTILDLLASAFPGQAITDLAPTVGGYSHQTLRATLGGEPCALKLAREPQKRADVRHEGRALELIAPLGLPAPAPRALIEGDGLTVLVTRALPGDNGLKLLDHPSDSLGPVYHALGQVAARIHAAPLPPPDPALLLATRLEHARDVLPGLSLDDALCDALLRALDHPAWQAPPRLLHGDLGLHNLLWSGETLALLDWEWASWGAPVLDLAWLAWTLRWRKLPEALWGTFLAGYGAATGDVLDKQTLRQIALGQIAMILVRTRGSAGAFAEWERRAKWTLGR
jgi:aminoglycoside phosphotransferase (APT) family kinase protein